MDQLCRLSIIGSLRRRDYRCCLFELHVAHSFRGVGRPNGYFVFNDRIMMQNWPRVSRGSTSILGLLGHNRIRQGGILRMPSFWGSVPSVDKFRSFCLRFWRRVAFFSPSISSRRSLRSIRRSYWSHRITISGNRVSRRNDGSMRGR